MKSVSIMAVLFISCVTYADESTPIAVLKGSQEIQIDQNQLSREIAEATSNLPPINLETSESEEIAGGACLQSAGVTQLAACPATSEANISIQFPMTVQSCGTAFPEIWNNKSQFDSASLASGTSHCKLIGDAEKRRQAAEQCAAIWYATQNMTQFNNPRGSNSNGQSGGRVTSQTEGLDANRRADLQMQEDRQAQQGGGASSAQTVGVNGMNCVGRSEYDLDYPACKRFVAWYNGLQLAETGLTAYNQNQQIQAGNEALQQTQQDQASGNQAAGLTGTATNLSAQASSQDRIMAFNAARAAAIGAQLATFPNPRNLASKCNQGSSACCAVLGRMPGSESSYFPNAQMKASMTAEIAKAVGAALAAKLAADAARKQKGIVNKIKEQITDGTVNNPGIINFCTQNPQDPRCLASRGPGAVSPGSFGGNSFTAGDFGTDSLGNATTGDEFGALDNEGGLVGTDSIGGIGDIPADVKEAKEAFNAPSAGANIGSPTGGGGGGAGAANASAPGLSKDPGAQGEQKPADTKVTSLGAAYNGAAYSGGAFRPGADRKPAAVENPFASLFGKDKAQDTAAVQIDAPASDLFVKISNRYSEVNKRKDLMEVK